jgi:DNA-binding NtrC family response regulator
MIITDLTMPNLTGDRLAREILKVRPNIPVVLCTGFSEMMDADKARQMGIQKFLMKPVSMMEFAWAIREVLDTPGS